MSVYSSTTKNAIERSMLRGSVGLKEPTLEVDLHKLISWPNEENFCCRIEIHRWENSSVLHDK
jgi:hypothetical protein